MTRNPDGTWKVTSKNLWLISVLIPILGVFSNIGMTALTLDRRLNNKIDRVEYIASSDTVKKMLAQHMEVTSLVIQRLLIQDSLLVVRQDIILNRLQEICSITRSGCR